MILIVEKRQIEWNVNKPHIFRDIYLLQKRNHLKKAKMKLLRIYKRS